MMNARTRPDPRRLILTLEAPPGVELHHRLKAALKIMLRRHKLRCIRITEERQ